MSQRHPIQNQLPMLITTNVKGKHPLFLEPGHAREAINALYFTQEKLPFFLYSFVIMPDHCHFLLKAPKENSISRIMYTFKRAVVFQVGQGALWQPRFHLVIPDRIRQVIRYIHMNPVKKGLCEKPEEYPWSSASGKWDVTLLSCFDI